MNLREVYYIAMRAKREAGERISQSLKVWRDIRAATRHQAMRNLEYENSHATMTRQAPKSKENSWMMSRSDSMSRTERNSRARDRDRRR